MRVVIAVGLLVTMSPAFCASGNQKKDTKKPAAPGPSGGVKTPGIQIPYANLKSELVYETPTPVPWISATDSIWIPSADGLQKIDPKGKEAKFGDPIAGLKKPCTGTVNAFGSLWVPNCGDGTIARIDAKSAKMTATLAVGTSAARPGIAATAESIWTLTDSRGTLSRIDPVQNLVVAEFRVYQDCNTLMFGEAALWLTCPAENRVLKVDPATNLVEKSIEVSARPIALAIGETSVWILCEKDGKIDRIDPKTNKVTKTIELGAPATGGTMAIGDGSVWVSMPGFPLTRVDPASEKVVQQFWGEGAGVIQSAAGSVWLADGQKVVKLDPKRVGATLAE